MSVRITRLAPSPTGALHLGNARTFLINWLMARQDGWNLVLRIEDLDGPRIKRGAAEQAIQDLRWLGLDWNQGPIFQSTRMQLYHDAIAKLSLAGWTYPCVCSRREVEQAASAPHADDGATVYPGTCRGKFASIDKARQDGGREPALRFAVPHGVVEFHDEFHGPQRCDVERDLGDFVIANGDGTPAYQLAVVVDDAGMNVTDIVRGDDLLDSTPRQILIYRALEMDEKRPRYWHLPLVVGPDGKRLAKRHGDTRIASYRDAGVAPQRLVGLLARWCGMSDVDETLPRDLLDTFDIAKVPRSAVVFDPRGPEQRWLESAR